MQTDIEKTAAGNPSVFCCLSE